MNQIFINRDERKMICAKERKDLIKFRNAEFEEHRQTTHSNVHSGLKSGEGKIVEER